MSNPCCCNNSASRRALWVVHRRGDIGSPLAPGSTMSSRDDFKSGCSSLPFFRPPPERLDRPGGRPDFSSNSLIPRMIVTREIPVARETIEMAPCPRLSVSVAAQSRRCRSFNVLLNLFLCRLFSLLQFFFEDFIGIQFIVNAK